MDREYQKECNKVLADIAIKASGSLSLTERIMIYQGLSGLFEDDSETKKEIENMIQSFATAEKQQLKLSKLLK